MISAFYTQSGIISGCKLLIRYAQDVLQTGLRSSNEGKGDNAVINPVHLSIHTNTVDTITFVRSIECRLPSLLWLWYRTNGIRCLVYQDSSHPGREFSSHSNNGALWAAPTFYSGEALLHDRVFSYKDPAALDEKPSDFRIAGFWDRSKPPFSTTGGFCWC